MKLWRVQDSGPVPLAFGTGRLTLEPGEVSIGQPVWCELQVVHDKADGLPDGLTAPLSVGEDWVLLDGPILRVEDLASGGRRSTARWQYMPLQPGSHAPSDYALTLKRGGEVVFEVGQVEVSGELEAGEEAPRPMAGELPAPEPDHGQGAWILLGVLAIAVLFLLGRRVLRKPDPQEKTISDDPLARLQQVQWQADGLPGMQREHLFAWHRDLRRVIDARIGQQRDSWTDEAWIATGAQSSGMNSTQWGALCELLCDLENHKFAAHLPSRLTGEELAMRVRQSAEEQQRLGLAELEPASGNPANTTASEREVPA